MQLAIAIRQLKIELRRADIDEANVIVAVWRRKDQVGWGIRLMLCTGMSTQELLGLEPRHIAEDSSTITIEQAVVMEKGTAVIGPPKSFDSYRTVPVPRNVQYCARMLRAVETKYVCIFII